MKKLTTLLIICCMALMLTFGLTACGDKTCEHIYDNACDAICNECEETRTITHDWNAADWQRKSITVWSIKFEHEYIRDIIINKMMPEDLDRAIAEAERKRWRISFDDFVEMIFVSVLLGDAIVDIQFKQTYLKGAC